MLIQAKPKRHTKSSISAECWSDQYKTCIRVHPSVCIFTTTICATACVAELKSAAPPGLPGRVAGVRDYRPVSARTPPVSAKFLAFTRATHAVERCAQRGVLGFSGPKPGPKSDQDRFFRCFFWHRFSIDFRRPFSSIFGANLGPKTVPKSSKNRCENRSIF